MYKITSYFAVLCLLPVIACDPGGQPADAAAAAPGPGNTAVAIVAAPQETIPTAARRVWSGPGMSPFVSLSPDGRLLSLMDLETGDLAVLDLQTEESRRVTQNRAPFDPGHASFTLVSPDGGQIAYTWSQDGGAVTELRVIEWDGSEPGRLLSDYSIPYAWSPDGRFVLVGRMGSDAENAALVLVNAVDGGVTVLESFPSSSLPMHADFSPDGRFVVYDGPSREGDGSRDIFVLELDGRHKTRLVDATSDDYVLGWAPDGGFVLFCSDRTGTPGVWLLPVRDGRPAGAPRLALPDAWNVLPVGFVPDGRHYYGVKTGAPDIYIATLSADYRSVVAPPTLAVARGPGGSASPSWSPDGQYLAFIRRQLPRSLAVRSMESGEVRELRLDEGLMPWGTPRWTPDGGSLVLAARDEAASTGAYGVDLQTGRTELLVADGIGFAGESIDLSRDGRFLYYAASAGDDDESAANYGRRVLRMDLDSGDTQEVYEAAHQIGYVAIAPDGSSLAVVVHRVMEDGPGSQILMLPASGGEVRELTPFAPGIGINSIAWTPESRAILYAMYRIDPAEAPADWSGGVWRVPAAGGQPEPIGLEMDGLIQNMRFHPDGRRLALVTQRTSFELWVMEDFLPGTG
jgi:Tol biopolymer transport system component